MFPSHPQVVLLHGITGSRAIFSKLEERLRSSPTCAETLSFDLLGFGANKNVPSSYELSEQLKHITASVNKGFPSGKVVLIGHSLGGVLALAWTVKNQDRVCRLILLNTPLGESREDIVRSLEQSGFGWASLLLNHRMLAHLSCIVFRGAKLARLFRFLKPVYVPDEVFSDYIAHNWKSLDRTFENILLGVPGAPLFRQMRAIPVLNLKGSRDDEVSQRAIAQSNVTNVTLPCGHLMLLECAEATFEKVEWFLA